MNLTLCTDASFSHKHQIGTYAYWMVCEGQRLKWSGPLKGVVHDSTEAEMMCILKALKRIQMDPLLSLKVKEILVNTDSLNSIWILTGNVKKMAKYRLPKPYHAELAKIFRHMRGLMGNVQVKFRHVKAHSGVDDKRSYVNEWCDQRCKQEIDKLITKIEQDEKENHKRAS